MAFIEQTLLPVLTVIGWLFIILHLGFLVYKRFVTKLSPLCVRYKKFMERRGLLLGWIVALVATLGSLYYSEVLNYLPCKLCWFQRVMIYPQSLILLIAMIRRSRSIFWYVLPLNVISALISGYHYVLQRLANLGTCGGPVDCSITYTFKYGFITIPFMAFTAALLIILFTRKD